MNKVTENEFLSVLEEYISIIIKIAYVYSFNNQDRKDLMSDIIFELWKSFPKYRNTYSQKI